ncbi:hypothetical protein [Thalassotalea ganghwensis]
MKHPLLIKQLIWLTMLFNVSAFAEHFVGQWHVFVHQKQVIAQTVDGHHKLQLIKDHNADVKVVLSLHNFQGFGTKHEVLEYHSPTYGLIRTVDYHHNDQQISLLSSYETKRFIANLKDIASHPLLLDENLAEYFNERKLTISFVDHKNSISLTQAKFSTIEIDEVLQKMEQLL